MISQMLIIANYFALYRKKKGLKGLFHNGSEVNLESIDGDVEEKLMMIK